MSEPTVLYEVSPARVATITLNRPAQLNAISMEMAEALGAALDRAAGDDAVGCIAIVGAGKGFCAGGDLNAITQRDGATDLSAEAMEALMEAQIADRAQMHARIPLRIHELDKPTVAIVNGAAAGAGFCLALACDLRVASTAAKLTTGYARIGRSGDFGGTFFLSRLIGPSRSRELYFTSEVLLAEQACRLGLVDHVYPPDEVRREGIALAERIAAGPPQALARMKQAFRVAEQGDLRRLLDLEARLQTLSGLSAEGQEFLSRFRATKRT